MVIRNKGSVVLLKRHKRTHLALHLYEFALKRCHVLGRKSNIQDTKCTGDLILNYSLSEMCELSLVFICHRATDMLF